MRVVGFDLPRLHGTPRGPCLFKGVSMGRVCGVRVRGLESCTVDWMAQKTHVAKTEGLVSADPTQGFRKFRAPTSSPPVVWAEYNDVTRPGPK